MNLKHVLSLVPVVALVIAACADQENPSAPRVPGDGNPNGSDGGANGSGPTGPTGPRGECSLTKPGSAGKLIKATLLLPENTVDGELLINASGVIACAAASCANAPGYADAAVITCKDVVASPGLINPHDHISFANNPPHTPTQERYEHRHDWRKGARQHTKIATGAKAVPNAVEAAELRFVMSGVTAIAGAGGANGLVRNVDGNAAQMEDGLVMAAADSDTFPLGDGNDTSFPTTCSGFTSSKRTTAANIAGLKGYLPHISEGIDNSAHAEFICQSNGVDGQDLSTYDLVERQTAVVHGMAVKPADVVRYRNDKAMLIWSPRSNVDLYGNTAPIALYANLGVPIALGTDWLPSGSMNMSRELRCADDLNSKYFGGKLTDKQLWESVTINAAFAIGADRALGQLKAGYVADVALFDGAGKKNPYRAVIEAGVEDTVLVLRAGTALYGDSDLVKEAAVGGPECEDIDVCSIKKKACVKKDLGNKSLADLQTAASSVYPLFFCKNAVPTNEPSCLPTRGPTRGQPSVSSYSGITETDKDGDGVPNATDNCPTVFNPIRPMDDGKQGDADGDGIGDACDRCPLAQGENCTAPTMGDLDGDGVPNGTDNCPEDANPDQADSDKDGKGAFCDKDGAGNACDDRPNPGSGSCPATFTIAMLRDATKPNHPKPGATRAILQNVWVTAVKTAGSGARGFFIQETGTQYAGMFVATGSTAPTVAVGNRVDVEGDYTETLGLSQLTNATVTVKNSGTTLGIQPTVIDPAVYASSANGGAAGEPWEGMLCIVEGPVTVSMQNADTQGDYDEFAVTASNLRVDDYVYDALDNTYAVGTAFQSIVGICGFSFNNRKVWPRTAADLTQ
jgi:cytosine/adenosine deaminase-related metal-dependent hydrolase